MCLLFQLILISGFCFMIETILALDYYEPSNKSYYLSNASSRIINPIVTNKIYPWMAFLLTQEWKDPNKQEDAEPWTCSAAVLSRRSIITAAHCICSQRVEKRDQYPECLLNTDKKNPANQIIPGRVIYYVVGQHTIDKRLILKDNWEDWKEVIYDLPRAQKAFSYAPQDFKEGIKGIDIGVLIVDIPVWQIANPIEDRNTVCSLELPDKGFKALHNIYVHIAGWGRQFSFGYHDREKKIEGTYDNPTKYSACMTTHESPESSQFQMCNTRELIDNQKNPINQRNIAKNTACHSEYPLDWEKRNGIYSQLWKEEECRAYWKAAERIMLTKLGDSVLQREFRSANRIRIDGKYCYRPELFRNKGWCKHKMKWGFCSSSCTVEFMKEQVPQQYHETEMRLVEKPSDQLKLCGLSEKFQKVNSAIICAIPAISPTKTLVFKQNPTSDRNLPTLVKDDPDIEFNHIETPKSRGYSGICDGDSGAPMWITKNVLGSNDKGPCSKKNILVGIITGNYNSRDYWMPRCTSGVSVAHKVIEKVLLWIRKNMARYDSNVDYDILPET